MKLQILAVAMCVVGVVSGRAAGGNWIPLFNGNDLAGWERYLGVPLPTSDVPGMARDSKGHYTQVLGLENDPLNCISIVQVDGRAAIRLSGEGYGTLTTLEPYTNYHLKLQFKWGSKKWLPGAEKQLRGSGVLYHGYGKHGDGDAGKRWLHAHQFQIQEGNCGDYVAVGSVGVQIAATKIDEKRYVFDEKSSPIGFSGKAPDPSRCSKSENVEKPNGEWNTLELICVGETVIHVVNRKVVLRAEGSKQFAGAEAKALTAGRIQLQMEGSEVFFRDIELKQIERVPAGFQAP